MSWFVKNALMPESTPAIQHGYLKALLAQGLWNRKVEEVIEVLGLFDERLTEEETILIEKLQAKGT